MKRLLSAAVTVLFLTALSGCEWSSSGDGETWNDEYNWANFSGMYRAPEGGVLVTTFTGTAGEPGSTVTVAGEGIATAVAGQESYSGLLDHGSVVPGSVTIIAGSFVLNDDGAGGLSGTGKSGAVNYTTGAWSIDLDGEWPPAGTTITATYQYTVAGTGGESPGPGSSGSPIYSLNVQQEGNLLRMIASDGTTFDGQMGSVRSTVGDLSELPEGTVEELGVIVASFEVSAGEIRIVGTLQGTLSQEEMNYGLFDRQMAATWMESNGTTADILGVAGTVSVYFPEPTPDDRPDTTTTP